MDALSSRDSIGEKLLRSKLSKPKMVFADFDGTLFTPNWKLLADPFFNTRISYLLRQQHIPLVIVTGRSGWTGIDIKQLFFLGIPSPDGAITANGTIIYTRIADTYQRDVVWEGMMQSSKVSFQDNTIHPWNKLEITTILRTHLQSQPIRFVIKTGNTYLIRIQVNKFPVNKLIEIKKSILALFPKGIKVVFTEKLLWENTQNLFSGDILITPTLGGKENAVKYLLEKYSSQISSQLLVHSSQNKITNNQSPITNNRLN